MRRERRALGSFRPRWSWLAWWPRPRPRPRPPLLLPSCAGASRSSLGASADLAPTRAKIPPGALGCSSDAPRRLDWPRGWSLPRETRSCSASRWRADPAPRRGAIAQAASDEKGEDGRWPTDEDEWGRPKRGRAAEAGQSVRSNAMPRSTSRRQKRRGDERARQRAAKLARQWAAKLRRQRRREVPPLSHRAASSTRRRAARVTAQARDFD